MPTIGRVRQIAGAVVLAVAIAMLIVSLARRGTGETLVTIAPAPSAQGPTVTVFVGGAVARPGVYTLARGERVEGAIAAAGGFSPDADQDGINRALLLRDEAQIVVPRKGEPTATPASPAAGATAPVAALASDPPGGGGTPAGGRINVNTADAAELERLPGVGAAIAEAIVAYRDANGPFATAADLAAVRGISARMVADWGDLITFGP